MNFYPSNVYAFELGVNRRENEVADGEREVLFLSPSALHRERKNEKGREKGEKTRERHKMAT